MPIDVFYRFINHSAILPKWEIYTDYTVLLQKLNKPEVLENIISTTPGLREDTTALVILQHPELLAKLGDSNAVRK